MPAEMKRGYSVPGFRFGTGYDDLSKATVAVCDASDPSLYHCS